MNFNKYLLIIFFYLYSNNYVLSQQINKDFLNLILSHAKDDFSTYIIINIEDELKQKQEVAVSTSFIKLYYFNDYLSSKKNKKKYLNYLKSLIKKQVSIIENSKKIEIVFKKNLIDNNLFLEIQKQELKDVLKKYFNSDYTINNIFSKETQNTVIKLIYNNQILFYQEELSGIYYLYAKPWIKLVLNPNSR